MSAVRAVLLGEVAGRRLAFDAAQVRAVLLAPRVTEVPGAAASLRGLVAWRERVVPLVSLCPGVAGRVAVLLEGAGELVAVELETVGALCEAEDVPFEVATACSLVGMSAVAPEVRA